MDHQDLFAGKGEMRALMRSMDWSATPLGAIENWSPMLKSAVRILLASRFPIQVLWGQEYVLLYNDAYRPILGNKHPQSLGQPGQECWQEMWDFAAPRLERVKATGNAEGEQDQLLLLERNGYPEECYFTFSYAPLYDEAGNVEGIFNEVDETTHRVLDERRQRLQNDLVIQVTAAKSAEEICQRAAATLSIESTDIPFALFYLFNSPTQVTLVSASGLQEPMPTSIPFTVECAASGEGSDRSLADCFARVSETRQPFLITPQQIGWESLPPGKWGAPVRSLLILPLVHPEQDRSFGFLVAGVNPHCELDQPYQTFFDSLKSHLAVAIARIHDYEEERNRAELLAELNRINQDARTALEEQSQLLDLTLDGILVRDLNDVITFWNRGAQELYGWTKLEALGQVSHPLLQTEFPKPLPEIRAELLKGDRWVGELVQRTREGRSIIVRSNWVLKRDAEGKPLAILETNHDITDHRLANDALRTIIQRLNFHMENNPLAVIEWSRDLVVMRWSRMAEQIFGWQAEEILGIKWGDWQFVIEADQEKVAKYIQEIYEQKPTQSFMESRNYTKSGEVVHCEWYNSVLLDAMGNVQSILSLIMDVTQRKRLAADLRQSEAIARQQTEELKVLMDVTPALVWIAHDPQCQFITANQTAYALMRMSRTDTKNVSASGLNHLVFRQQKQGQDIPTRDLPLQKSIRTGEEVEDELELVFEDGTVYYIYGRAVPLWDEQGHVRGAIAAFLDISDRKRAEAERESLLARAEAARSEAETANRIKDEFLAVLSHELRSPLNPILGWSKLLRTGRLDAEKTTQALETIERNARLQAQLIEDLLDVSRILRGKLSLTKVTVDLKTTIEAAIDTVQLAAEAKKIELQFEIESTFQNAETQNDGASPSPNLPSLSVLGDSARLQQIIWNLLSNSIKFTPEGGRVEVRLERIVAVKARDGGGGEDRGDGGVIFFSPASPSPTSPPSAYAQITVTDTGKGITPDFMPYMFDYFRQADSTTTRTFGGLGLGLAIVRHLLELHDGMIYATSKGEGQGASFTVILPLVQAIDLGYTTPSPALSSSASRHLENVQALVVDDDPDAQKLLRFILERAGAEVIAVSSAVEALRILANSSINVLVSDIGMPEMNGYTLIRHVQSLYADREEQLPIAIALTAYAGEADRKQALQAGYQRHFAKPLNAEELIATISSLLLQRQAAGR